MQTSPPHKYICPSKYTQCLIFQLFRFLHYFPTHVANGSQNSRFNSIVLKLKSFSKIVYTLDMTWFPLVLGIPSLVKSTRVANIQHLYKSGYQVNGTGWKKNNEKSGNVRILSIWQGLKHIIFFLTFLIENSNFFTKLLKVFIYQQTF